MSTLSSRTQCKTRTRVLLSLFALFGLLCLPSIASAYTGIRTLRQTSDGQNLTTTFTSIPRSASNISVTIDLYGDYDSSTEYANVYIDTLSYNSTTTRHNGGGSQCNTNLTGTNARNRRTYPVSSFYANDNRLTVRVDLSSSVNLSTCRTANPRVVITVSYTDAQLPELYMSSWTTQSSAFRGTTIPITFSVRNNGSVNAGSFYVAFYMGTSASTSGLSYIGRSFVNSLAARTTSTTRTINVTIPSNYSAGTRYIHYYVDYLSQRLEQREDNNRGWRSINISSSTLRPNLRLSSFTPPTAMTAGRSSLLRFTANNNGSANASAFYVYFYYSTSTSQTNPPLRYLGRYYYNTGLARGASLARTLTVTIPTNVNIGRGYIHYYVDATRQVAESNELDNRSSRVVTITSTPRADLYMSGTVSMPSTVIRGTRARLSFSVRNNRTVDAGQFYVYFYYGNDSSTNSLSYLGRYSISSLRAQSTSPVYNFDVTIPTSANTGTRYMHWFVDGTNRILETSETNNRGSRSFTVSSATTAPDLVNVGFTGTTSANPGGTVSVTITVRNNGTANASSFYVAFYYGDTSSTNGLTYRNRVFYSSLTRGASSSRSVSFTLPTNASAGTRYLHYYIDYLNARAETNETNNRGFRSIRVNTVARPDLYMSSLSTPTSVARGTRVPLSFSIRNSGSVNASQFYVYFYYGNSTSTSGLTYLGRYSVSSLARITTSPTYVYNVTIPTNANAGTRYLHWFVDGTSRILETNETNNRGLRTLNVSSSTTSANLNFLSTGGPSSAARGTSVRLTTRVRNTGSANAGSFYVYYYFGTSSSSTTGLSYLGRVLVSSLARGATTGNLVLTATVPSSAPTGTRYFHFHADALNAVVESNETDNRTLRGVTITTGITRPDLAISSFAAPTSAQGYLTRVAITTRVRNIGTANAGGFYVSYYYGDSTSTTGISYLGRFFVSSLTRGGTTGNLITTVTLPSTVLAGTRYLHYYIDYLNQQTELNEGNNRGVRSISITGRPDLQISVLTLTPTSQGRGGTIAVRYTIYNAGYSRVPTSFITRLYFSTNSIISTGDTYLNVSRTLLLNARSSSTTTSNVTVPLNASVGSTQYIGALADYNGRVSETSESNNYRAAPFNVASSTNAADLTISTFTAPTSALGYLTRVPLTFRVRNNGSANAGNFYVSFYYGDSTSTSGLTYMGRYLFTGVAARSTSSTRTYSVTLPSVVLNGSRRIHYFIDYLNAVREGNENNNRGSRAITITGRPDLQISSVILSPTTQGRGGNISVRYTIYNAGYSRVPNTFFTRLYFSTNSSITTGDTYLNVTRTLPGLNARSNSTTFSNVVVPTSATIGATQYIGAIADYSNTVRNELSEANNSRGASFRVASTANSADLQISSFTASSSATGYLSRVPLTFRVRNTGSANAGNFYVAFYYGDSTSTSGLTYMGRYFFSSLSTGATSPTRIYTVTLPNRVLEGTRYIHYYIDYLNAVREGNENNNRGSRSIRITSAPNLQISSVRLNPTAQVPGSNVTVTYSIYNAGSSRVPSSFTTRLYFSTNSIISTGDTYLNVSRTLSGILARQTLTYTAVVRVPTSARIGSTQYIGALADYSNAIRNETSESDNGRAAPLNIASTDLVMSSWRLNTTSALGAGSPVTVTFQVRNAGNANAGSFTINFYYGDTTSTLGLTNVASFGVSSLNAGTTLSTRTLRLLLPSRVLFGSRRIHYFIDSSNRVRESNESNNRGSLALNITGRPDLQISSVRVLPSTQTPGGTSTLRYRVYNAGYSRADNFAVGLYYSTNSSITTSDTQLATANIRTLNGRSYLPSSTGFLSASLRLPTNAALGTRYLGAFADATTRITETSETNNARSAAFSVISSKADLSMLSWQTNVTSARGSGSAVTVTFNVRNSGAVNAGAFTVTFYYGDSTGSSGLTVIGSRNISSLNRTSSTSNLTVSATLPNVVLAGNRYLHYFIDSANRVSESNEANNRGFRSFRITGQPNLQVSVLTVSPTTADPNGTLRATYRVYNAGYSRVSTLFYTRFYFSNNNVISTGDVYLNQEVRISSLNARSSFPASGNGTVNLQVPTNAQPGKRWIGAYTDYNGRVAESSNTDNTKAVEFTVRGKPDLVALKITPVPNTVEVGKQFKADYEIANRGSADAGTYRVTFYYSTDSTIDATDTAVLTFTLSGLTAGRTARGSRTVTLPTSLKAGKGYIGMIVDADKKIAEGNENNNVTASPFTVLVDEDKDGFTNDKDCNDKDKTVYPGAKELCDGKNNDCDSEVDEGCQCKTGDKRACYTPGNGCTRQSDGSYKCAGLCKAGTQTCTAGKWDACTGETGPASETCDNKDNNCDGQIDENVTRKCYSGPTGTAGKGVCKEGTETCAAGQWGTCTGEQLPTKESCNGKDDDCDGQIDGHSRRCYGGPAGTAGKGECKQGTETCTNSQWGSCTGEVTPATESCNGKDDDCDGQIDNQTGGSTPLERACQNSCGNGTETCVGGSYQNCSAPVTCEKPTEQPTTEVTPETVADAGGESTPDAGGESTPEGNGESTPEGSSDCYTKGCPSGQICKEGACVSDPCSGVNCKSGEFCREGNCVKSCGCTRCPAGERCADGACISDPCANASCASGEVCDPSNGQCVTDPCASITCGKGRICQGGKCVDDACNYITCPSSMTCQLGQCVGQNCSEATGETTGESTTEATTDAGPGETATETVTDSGTPETATEAVTDNTTTPETAKEAVTDTITDTTPDAGPTDVVKDEGSTNTEKTTGGNADKSSDKESTVVGGGCCSINNKEAPSPFLLFLGFMMLMLPFFRRRRK